MSIQLRCQSCQKLLRVPDTAAGKKAKCPQCGEVTAIPAHAPSAETAGSAAVSFEKPAGGQTAPPNPGHSQHADLFANYPDVQSGANPFADREATAYGSTDAANPYASPAAAYAETPGKSIGGKSHHRQTNISELFDSTWRVYGANLGPLLLYGLVLLAIQFGAGVATTIIETIARLGDEFVLVAGVMFLNQVLTFCVNTWFQIGTILFMLRIARTGKWDLADLFASGPYFLRGLVLLFLYQLAVGGVFLLCLLPALATIPLQEEEVTIIAFIAGLAIGAPLAIYVSLTFFTSLFFLVDQDTDVMGSFAASKEYMSGNRMTLFGALFVAGVVGVLFTIFTCGIGLFFVVPYLALFGTMLYLLTTSQYGRAYG